MSDREQLGRRVPRGHPVREVLDGASRGYRPSKADLDTVDAQVRRAVAAAAQAVVAIHATGQFGDARREAAAFTDELVGDDVAWNPVDDIDTDDPAALARQVHGEGDADTALRNEIANIRR